MKINIKLNCLILILSAMMAACVPFDDRKSEDFKHLFDFDRLFGKNDLPEYQPDDSYKGIDDVSISEYTKNGRLVRIFCDEKTGLIKLKMGSENERVKTLDSPESVKKAMKMPESDYVRLGGGVMDMVTTIGTGKKGHSMILGGVGIYVLGSEDTAADLANLENIDFIYTPCSYKMADNDSASAENNDNDHQSDFDKKLEELKRASVDRSRRMRGYDESNENEYGWEELNSIAQVPEDPDTSDRSKNAGNRDSNAHKRKGSTGSNQPNTNSKKKKRKVDGGGTDILRNNRPKDTEYSFPW